MKENCDLREDGENRILRYNGNTREVERINITKKINNAEQATANYLDERRRRLIRDIKEMRVDEIPPEDIDDAID